MLRHLVDACQCQGGQAAVGQSAADLGYSSLKISTRGGSCSVCNRPYDVFTELPIAATAQCCGKLIAFLQNKLGYWSVTRSFLLAKGRQHQTTVETMVGKCR